MNQRNFGIAEGRLTKDPVIFNNNDGSRKIMVTLAVQDNFKGRDGKKGTQFIDLEAFVGAGQQSNGVFEYIHKGDLVGIEYTVRTNNYEKNGETVYGQVLFIQNVDLKESKNVTDARRAQGDAEPAAAPAPAPAPAATGKKGKKGVATDAAPDAEDAPFGE